MLPLSRPAVSCGAFSPEYISPVGAGAILLRSRRMGSIKRPLNQECFEQISGQWGCNVVRLAMIKPGCSKTSGFTRSNLTASGRWFLAKL